VTIVSAGLTYAVCCSELLENDHHLVFINGANTFRIVPGASHVPLGVRGYTADSRGCVLLFEEHWLDISLRMLHFGPTSMTSRYLLYNTDDVGMVRCSLCLSHRPPSRGRKTAKN